VRLTVTLAWFSSAFDLQSIILFRFVCEAIRRGELDARILVLLCTRRADESSLAAQLADVAATYGVPVVCVPTSDFRTITPALNMHVPGGETWRERFESAVIDSLVRYDPTLVILAGYMWIAGSALLKKYHMINLHPALPGGPVGTRHQVIEEIILRGERTAGAMMHVVTAQLDLGPVLTYARIVLAGAEWEPLWSRRGPELHSAIERAILHIEPHLVLETLKVLAGTSPDGWPPSLKRGWPIEIEAEIHRQKGDS
jgi:phosphoribosylglycinamide formyltransferase-1